ncbi:MAG: hypothetical protein ACT4QF_05595 [Sporichthyaceae bacterium]
MPWHWKRAAGTRSPSVVPALLAALALLFGLPTAAAASAAEAARSSGGVVATAGPAGDRAEKLARQSAPTLKLGRADAQRFGPVDRLDNLGAADLAGAASARRSPLFEVASAPSIDPLPNPARANLHSRAPPTPHAVLASGVPLHR